MTTLIYPSSTNTEYSRDQLASVITPPPLGAFHAPYSFTDFVDTIHNGLEQQNIEVVGEEYVTSHENNRLFGALELRIPAIEGEYIPAEGPEDHRIVLGLRGSHDQSITRGLAIGSQVLVCSNLCFNGNLGQLNTKQTTNIGSRLPGLIHDALALIPAEAAKNLERFDRYKNNQLEQYQGDAILVELLRRGGISAPQLAKAVREWDAPTHDDHAEFGFSTWRLFNACTEAVKPTGNQSNPGLVEQKTSIIASYLDNSVALH